MRRAANLCTTTSLLLLVALAALWVRSLSRRDYTYFQTATRERGFDSLQLTVERGRVGIIVTLVRFPKGVSAADAGAAADRGGNGGGVGINRRSEWWVTRYAESPMESYEPRGLWNQGRPMGGHVRNASFTLWGVNGVAMDIWSGSVPMWCLAALFAILPAVRLARRARRLFRARPGACATCGYDLRATPERCPECGTVRPTPPTSRPPAAEA